MKTDLTLHNLGLQGSIPQAIELAHRHGFESVGPDARFLASLSDGQMADLRAGLEATGLVFGAARLALDFRGDEDTFVAGLKELPAFAHALERAGVTRVSAWVRPRHETLTYLANFKQHVRRLRAVAEVLAHHGLRLGLEYVAPKTSWASHFPFIHTLAETRELITEMGQANVGVALDSWHWFHAGETEADLLPLTNQDIVVCEVNDAPAGVAKEQMLDNARELPCTTGVIDLRTFLAALVKVGYDGPVRPEPFNAAFRALPLEQAVATAAQAMGRALALLR